MLPSLCFSLQSSADHNCVWQKCQLPQSCICKFSSQHPTIAERKIYGYETKVHFYVSFCPRLPSRRMSADRFVTAVLTTCALWLTELPWFIFICCQISRSCSNLPCEANILEHYLKLKMGHSCKIHYNTFSALCCLHCVSIGHISSWHWHCDSSRLLCCGESQQLLSKH